MSFDWNVARGEAALMEHLAFEQQRSRAVAYPVVTARVHSPSQAVTSTALAAMSQQSRQSLSLSPASSWLPLDMTPATTTASASVGSSSPEEQQAPSPGYHSSASSPLQHQPSPFQTAAHPTPSLLTDWPLPQQHVHHHAHQAHHELSHFIQDSSLITFNSLMPNFQPAPLEYMPATSAGLPGPMPAFSSMSPVDDANHSHPHSHSHSPAHHPAATSAIPWGMGMANWQDFEAAILANHPDGLPRVGSLPGSHSPTGTYLEVLSLNSGSDNGWTAVDVFPNYDQYQQAQQPQSHNAAIFNPGQTLHLRTNSDSSHSDGNSLESSGYEEIPFPYSPFSPNSDTCLDSAGGHRRCCPGDHHHAHAQQQQQQQQHHHQHSRQHASPELMGPVGPVSHVGVGHVGVGPVAIKTAPASGKGTSGSGSGSGSASSSPPNRRNSGGPRKSPIAKATKAVIRRSPTGDSKKDGAGEKKVGRRRGPLRPDQRKQASEIRKLRACLRCKFLKKTCDTGEPCNGCQPAHARLWQVPCTRIDIKDIGFFMKDWKADYERHLGRGVSVFNVKGFAPKETLMWITHGYGFCLPVPVREVYVADESCFQLDWVESSLTDQEPINFEIRTERLDVGHEGINMEALNEYLDKHVDEGFERFIDDHFEGALFITEIFKTAYRFYQKTHLPVIRKALKLVVAYNLTLHITMIESSPVEQQIDGQIDDEDSKYFGKTVAPVMINFQIKCAMADMWRDLQKDVLEELSALYSSVYSGERLKNWPTIFMLASILLAVWEEMQFDCHYRVLDPVAVNKFCTDMEQTPVGVIVGLFHAISQKLPAFAEWDTRRHGQLLQNNPAVCEAMTEVREHVIKHEAYLRTRQDCKFDRYDFDSLTNKFLSKLVIRAN